jgi:hypothetical protein
VLVPGQNGVQPSPSPLSHDVVILGLGMRYKALRAGCVRTLLIDPTKKQMEVYDIVLRTHEALLKALVPGVVIGEAVQKVRDQLLAEPNLPADGTLHRNFGSGVGARMSERHLALTTKNTALVEVGMAFAVTTGLKGVPMSDKHAVASAASNRLETYSVCLGDTLLVTESGPVVLTDKCSRSRLARFVAMTGQYSALCIASGHKCAEVWTKCVAAMGLNQNTLITDAQATLTGVSSMHGMDAVAGSTFVAHANSRSSRGVGSSGHASSSVESAAERMLRRLCREVVGSIFGNEDRQYLLCTALAMYRAVFLLHHLHHQKETLTWSLFILRFFGVTANLPLHRSPAHGSTGLAIVV